MAHRACDASTSGPLACHVARRIRDPTIDATSKLNSFGGLCAGKVHFTILVLFELFCEFQADTSGSAPYDCERNSGLPDVFAGLTSRA